ncbi:APC family permease [Haloglomus irregulare]|uniref:APC family permease n=1 Tax=Haloglomus irregulare TaxID=2234134 RepID=UPI001EE2DB86|nr:APC family permease [Haloglomus irregulare]
MAGRLVPEAFDEVTEALIILEYVVVVIRTSEESRGPLLVVIEVSGGGDGLCVPDRWAVCGLQLRPMFPEVLDVVPGHARISEGLDVGVGPLWGCLSGGDIPEFGEGAVDTYPSVTFEGHDLITTATEMVENPRENIPKAIFVSLAATVVYMLVVTVAIGTLGADGLAAAGEAGIATAATAFMPAGLPVIRNGGAIIVFGAIFSTVTALNAVVIASSRVAFSMGREGQLLPRFGTIHHRFGTPFLAILGSAVVMLGSVALPTQSAGNMSSLFFLLSFIVVNGALIKLRRERPDMSRPYEVPYYPVPPVLAILLNLLLTGVLIEYLFRTDRLALALSAGWIVLGVVAYYALERRRASATEDAPAAGIGPAEEGDD